MWAELILILRYTFSQLPLLLSTNSTLNRFKGIGCNPQFLLNTTCRSFNKRGLNYNVNLLINSNHKIYRKGSLSQNSQLLINVGPIAIKVSPTISHSLLLLNVNPAISKPLALLLSAFLNLASVISINKNTNAGTQYSFFEISLNVTKIKGFILRMVNR